MDSNQRSKLRSGLIARTVVVGLCSLILLGITIRLSVRLSTIDTAWCTPVSCQIIAAICYLDDEVRYQCYSDTLYYSFEYKETPYIFTVFLDQRKTYDVANETCALHFYEQTCFFHSNEIDTTTTLIARDLYLWPAIIILLSTTVIMINLIRFIKWVRQYRAALKPSNTDIERVPLMNL